MPLHNERAYNEPQTVEATIAQNGSLSAAVRLPPACYLSAIIMPSAWTTANLSFQGSHDNSDYNDIYDEYGSEIIVNAGAARHIVLQPAIWSGTRFLKIRSGTTGTPVTQAAERTLELIVRPY
jgi:hypothetical protein